MIVVQQKRTKIIRNISYYNYQGLWFKRGQENILHTHKKNVMMLNSQENIRHSLEHYSTDTVARIQNQISAHTLFQLYFRLGRQDCAKMKTQRKQNRDYIICTKQVIISREQKEKKICFKEKNKYPAKYKEPTKTFSVSTQHH